MASARYVLLEPTGSSTENIGEGAYGVVYKAYDKQTGQMVALKKMKAGTDHDGVSTSTLREFALLNNLSHENVLVDYDLKKVMESATGYLDPELVESYSSQLLEGLSYCHSMGVMHRDIKPQNILISRGGNLKIADFGLARSFLPASRSLTPAMVTRWYRAPEILLGYSRYDSSIDLWSVACVIVDFFENHLIGSAAEMSNKRALFTGDSEIDQIHKIFCVLGTPSNEQWSEITSLPFWRNTFPDWFPLGGATAGGGPAEVWRQLAPRLGREGADLISKLLVYNPQKRLSALDALSHPYVLNFRQRQAAKAAAKAAAATTVTSSMSGSSAGDASDSHQQLFAFLTPPAAYPTVGAAAARGGLLPRGRTERSNGGLGIAEEVLHEDECGGDTALGTDLTEGQLPRETAVPTGAGSSSKNAGKGVGKRGSVSGRTEDSAAAVIDVATAENAAVSKRRRKTGLSQSTSVVTSATAASASSSSSAAVLTLGGSSSSAFRPVISPSHSSVTSSSTTDKPTESSKRPLSTGGVGAEDGSTVRRSRRLSAENSTMESVTCDTATSLDVVAANATRDGRTSRSKRNS